MLSSTLECIHGRTMLVIAMLSFLLGAAHNRKLWALNVIITFWIVHTVEWRRHCMPLSILDCTHAQMTQGIECDYRPCAAYMVGWSLECHAIMALEQHTRSYYLRCGMLSSALDSICGRTTSGVAYHHRPWNDNSFAWCHTCMPSSQLDSIHKVGLREMWQTFIILRKHTQGRSM